MNSEITNGSIAAPSHITSLATCAILVQVCVSTSTGSKRDKTVSEEVAKDKQAKRGSVDVSKRLFSGCPEHEALTNFTATVNNYMREVTAPWADGGLRILPMNRYAKFMTWYNWAEGEHARLKTNFLNVYDTLVNTAALGQMFNRADYPHRDTVGANFTISLYKQQIPMGDFRVSTAKDLADDLHDYYTKQTKQYVDSIMDNMTDKFITLMERVRRGCGHSETTKKDGTISVTRNKLVTETVEKAIEMCDTLRELNPTGDARLEEARSAFEALLRGVDVEKLRNSDTLRANMEEDISDILSKFKR